MKVSLKVTPELVKVMPMVFDFELTPSLISILPEDTLRQILLDMLSDEAKSNINISADAEGALNAIESAKKAINEIIIEKDDNTLTDKLKAELIKNVKDEYKNGMKPADIALKHNLDWSTTEKIIEDNARIEWRDNDGNTAN
jgi:hypothetical protein